MSDTDRHRQTASQRAGLKFPVGRIRRLMRQMPRAAPRLAGSAPVYVAAVLEYLVAEIFVNAGEHARAHKKKRIGARDINLGVHGNPDRDVHGDAELAVLFQGRVVASGGEPPFIHAALLSKTQRAKLAARQAATA